MSEIIENARIARTHFGVEGHGMMTFLLQLEGPGWSQAFGGYNLGAPQLHFAKLASLILSTVGVERWEDLPGKLVRARRLHATARIDAIGHIIESRWLVLSDAIAECTVEGTVQP